MNNSSRSFSNGHSEEHVDRAIAAVLSLPTPMESLQRMVGTAASWDSAVAISLPRPFRRWSIAIAATAAIGLVLVTGLWLLFSRPGEKLQEANAEKEVAAEKEVKGD